MSGWKHNGFTFTGGNTYGTPRDHQLLGNLTLTGIGHGLSSGVGTLMGTGIATSDYFTKTGISEKIGKTMMTTPKTLVSNDFKNSETGEKFQIYYDGDSETHVWSKDGKITKMRHY